MTEYIASNGYRIVAWDKATGIRVHNAGHVLVHELGKYTVDALREYFQADRDNELGRVRDTLGSYAIYPHADGQRIRIMDEASGKSWEYWRDFRSSPKHGPALIASVYFSSHPEPKKPWEDAKEGDVWALKFGDLPERSWFVNGRYFQSTRTLTNILPTDKNITAGRRIYPEATE